MRAADGQWQPIECVPADRTTETMFDVVRTCDDFETEGLKWNTWLGGQNARSDVQRDTAEHYRGTGSLRVDYEFVGQRDFEYIQLNSDIEIPKPGYGFGFWMKHDGTPFTVRLRCVDVSGETHQVDLLASAKPGWQFVAGLVDGHTTAWSGDGNKRQDYPCRPVGICIDRPRVGFQGKGSLWIDDVALLSPRKESHTLHVEVQPPRYGNLYAVGDEIALTVRGQGQHIRWTVADFWNRQLAAGQGPAKGAEARFHLDKAGYFACTLELLDDDRVIETEVFHLAALLDLWSEDLLGGKTSVRSDFAGVCSHFGQRAYPLPSMELMLHYGIDQFRDEIHWRVYEAQKAHYAMPDYAAAYLQRAAELKMRPLIIFDYNNPRYDGDGFPNSPEAIAGFAAYSADLARQTQGTVTMFEVWNEWIGGCGMSGRPGDHGPEAYGRLLKPTYEAVKKAVPNAMVVGIGGEYGPHCAENIVGSLGTAGTDAMDAWSIHPYRYPRGPEESDLIGEVTRIANRVSEAGGRGKAWITEIGWPTHRGPGGSDEAAQARYCVRTHVLLKSTGVVEKIFWYDFKDDGLNRFYNEHNFGLVHHQHFNCAPKPGIVALSVLIRMTAAAEFETLDHTGNTWSAVYRKSDGRQVMVAWADDEAASVTLSGQVEATFDMMGSSQPVSTSIELTGDPVYVVGKELKIQTNTRSSEKGQP